MGVIFCPLDGGFMISARCAPDAKRAIWDYEARKYPLAMRREIEDLDLEAWLAEEGFRAIPWGPHGGLNLVFNQEAGWDDDRVDVLRALAPHMTGVADVYFPGNGDDGLFRYAIRRGKVYEYQASVSWGKAQEVTA